MNQHERCECHDCTQARYRSSLQWQLDASLREIDHQPSQWQVPIQPLQEPKGQA
jgi:hypothetical protein